MEARLENESEGELEQNRSVLADNWRTSTVRYSARSMAEAMPVEVAESTIRNRWFEWIAKVAPERLLKDAKGYTELARVLFAEFSQIEQHDRHTWVEEAKARYAEAFEDAGVIECELVPAEVGGTLALLQGQNQSLEALLEQEFAAIDEFVDQLGAADTDLSEAEIRSFQANGAKRAVTRFKIETQSEASVYSKLRQKRFEQQGEQ